jgi:hypothetical protein
MQRCVVHDFSIELYWLDVNVKCQPNVCSFKWKIYFQVDWRAGGCCILYGDFCCDLGHCRYLPAIWNPFFERPRFLMILGN